MSSHNTNTKFKSILHQVLKMTAFCSHTGGESHTPLVYCFVYDTLSNAVPHTQWALTQLVDVIYAFLVDPLLHYSPDFIIHGFISGLFGGHWSGEMKTGISQHKSAIVSCALCTGALSCWNMKLTPNISLMHGNSFSFGSTSR